MWAVNQWWKGGARGAGEPYRVKKEKETKRGKEKDRRGEKEDRWQNRMEGKERVQDSKRQNEGGKEGGAGLTSTWFNILLYSVLRASRVTRTRPS